MLYDFSTAEGRDSDHTEKSSETGQDQQSLSRDSTDRAGQVIHRPITLKKGAHVGECVKLQPIGFDFISRMVELQNSERTGNTIFRDEKFLRETFNRGDKAFGVVTKTGDLVAQAVVRSNMELLPAELRDKFNDASGRHAYIGSIIVRPDYQGNGLMGHMLQHALKEAKAKNNTDIHARVLTGNEGCLAVFQKHFDFSTIMIAQSPESSEPRIVHFLHRKL